MGFWSLFKRNKESFKFSNEPPSRFLQAALADASKHPINDFTYRLVIATPEDLCTASNRLADKFLYNLFIINKLNKTP